MPRPERDAPTIDELEKLAERDDGRAIAKRFAGLDEPRRRELGRELVPLVGDRTRDLNHDFDSARMQRINALVPALLATATLSEIRKLGWATAPDQLAYDACYDVLADRRPDWLAEWADWALGEWPWIFGLVRRLVRNGVLARPTSDAYILAMMSGRHHGSGQNMPLYRDLLADPDLLQHDVWRLFELEGGGEISLAAIDKFSGGDTGGWSAALIRLAGEGHLSRARLLDESLAALGRDFSSFRAGWHSRFHEALEPTLEERAGRADAYARLLASPIANSVSFALAALAALDKAGQLAASAELVDRLAPALASERKATAQRALALLASAVKRDAALREPAALAACDALGHEAADVQKRALDVLEPAAAAPAVQLRLLELSASIAPTLRDRLSTLVGLALDPSADSDRGVPALAALDAQAAALPERARALAGVDAALAAARDGVAPPRALAFAVTQIPVLATATRVEPIASLDELIDAAGHIIENPAAAPGDVERALDAIARLCAERPGDFERRTSSLRRRAARAHRSGVRALLAAWLSGEQPPDCVEGDDDPVSRRALELAHRVVEQIALPLLAAPTHEGGWIAPSDLVERLAAFDGAGEPPATHDLIQALMRMAPDRRSQALERAAGASGDAGRAVRAALGGDQAGTRDDTALEHTVALARGVDSPGPRFSASFQSSRYGSPMLEVSPDPCPSQALRQAIPALRVGTDFDWRDYDAPGAHTARGPDLVHLWPAGHESLWAHAVQELAFGVHPYSGGRDSRMLEPALDPDRPLGELGALAVLLGLMHTDAGVRATAVDAAIVAIADGRLDAALLGAPYRMLMTDPGFPQPARLGTSLRTIAAESPLHAEVVRLTLEATIALDDAPRALHALLDPLNELCADAGAAVADPQARRLLQTLKGSSKAAKLAKALLDRDGVSRHAPTAARLAAVARIERARRWSDPSR